MVKWLLALTATTSSFALFTTEVLACGCFAQTTPATPVVQAGEAVVFAHDGTNVEMHVQIAYQGPAEEFAWLLPMPSVPEVQLSTIELFQMLRTATAPSYSTAFRQAVGCNVNQNAPRDASAVGSFDGGAPVDNGPPGVLVQRTSVGPYDSAVIRADDQTAMFEWLTANEYFVPAAAEDALAPYVRPGAYFLALKLLKDKETGDIQPISLNFESGLPMIPIVLTSVGATEDMPVLVWVVGKDRAIPRNYRHTILNEEHIDWFTAGQNYLDVVTNAVDEAEGAHSFVTEFAGATTPFRNRLAGFQRFGERRQFERTPDAGDYVEAMRINGFPFANPTVIDILADTFPMPEELVNQGIDSDAYYANLDFYLGNFRQQNPEIFEGVDFSFDPLALTALLWEAIVEPSERAEALLTDNDKITRLFTTLSPDEMTLDPVFSFNPDLPDVSNIHQATFRTTCDSLTFGNLELPDGRVFQTSRTDWANRSPTAPFSWRIELLREEGEPEVEVDNTERMSRGIDPSLAMGARDGAGCGCNATSGPATTGGAFGLLLLALLRRRKSVG